MNLRNILLPLAALATVAASPPAGIENEDTVLAERRLRACLSASASGGHGTVEAAVVSARVACKPQIDKLRNMRILAATAGMKPEAALVVERRVTRTLNTEIAHAVANFSGLPLAHAHNR